MKPFLSEDFLLQTPTACTLYHQYAEQMPIFDFHCHIPVRQIAGNASFENLTRIWLDGDHYKWRAMRSVGVPERLITGDAADDEKFEAWASTVPKTIGNPLYHWTHMELKRPFGISGRLLNPETWREIYDRCSGMLQTEAFRAQGILGQMNVRAICTTDDPADSLENHRRIAVDGKCPARVLPGFRGDSAMAVERPDEFNAWVARLEAAADAHIASYPSFLEALRSRHASFHDAGCRLSDLAMERPYAADYTERGVGRIFDKVRKGAAPEASEALQFKAALLSEIARMNYERGWVQQFHIGALRNTNTRAMGTLGRDSGYDSIGDFEIAGPLAKLLDALDREGRLAKTVIYVLNPADNELAAAMIGGFQDGSVSGKIQFGPAWWFNDQKSGIEKHLDALSNMGLLSLFVGMVSDSRSFLSYPRHEYFRRILCNFLGSRVDEGELPDDQELLGGIVQDISYRNARTYFGMSFD
ncbi:glucuronate isomerase [Thermodesulfobacteriota bacterium]